MLGVDKKLVGTPVTVGNSDNDNYAFYYMDADGEAIVAVSPDGWEDVLTQGKITVTMTPGENETSAVKATFDFTLKGGGKFTGEADCAYKAPEKLPSEYSLGDEVRALKSVVATTLGGFQYVYKSGGRLDYGGGYIGCRISDAGCYSRNGRTRNRYYRW